MIDTQSITAPREHDGREYGLANGKEIHKPVLSCRLFRGIVISNDEEFGAGDSHSDPVRIFSEC